MVPIPQYPLYSATISEYGMTKVDYYLEEETGWSLDRKELQRSYDEAKKVCNPRALVVINPGNPTGQVLTRENIEEIIKFAHDNKVLVLADEVYQDNVYDKNSKFWSFKKVAYEMGDPYRNLEMVSFLSTSKGYLGECGIRGGYMEVLNLDPKVKAMLTKSITAALCSTTAGQVAVSALVNPPQPGEPSYDLYKKERDGILAALKERAELVHKALNSFEGYKVNPVQGAMYVFPQIEIPPKAIEAAKAKGMAPDVFYAFELLETSGEFSLLTSFVSLSIYCLIFSQAFALFLAVDLVRSPVRGISEARSSRKRTSWSWWWRSSACSTPSSWRSTSRSAANFPVLDPCVKCQSSGLGLKI